MASGLSRVVLVALSVILFPPVSAGDRDCKAYTDFSGVYHYSKKCPSFCCGTCSTRYCCQDSFWRLTEDAQDECDYSMISHSPLPMIFGILSFIVILLIIICCCVCPCCCLYKACRKPRPVIATTTHTTVVTNTNTQSYPQQPTMHVPPQNYQSTQYPPYQPVPVQPGFGAQPMATTPYPGQPYVPGPPPTYQEATGPAYGPTPMPYSQAAFTPAQPAYPIHPPAPTQPNAPPANIDFLSQPAFNPDFVTPPPKTG